jgi:glycerol uptake facilitator-like aquaporin
MIGRVRVAGTGASRARRFHSAASRDGAAMPEDHQFNPPLQTSRRVPTTSLARQVLAEAALTFVLLFGVVTLVRWIVGASPVSQAIPDIRAEVALIGAAVAVLLTALILSPLGRISGGHMNPAISLAMWRYGVFPASSVPRYIVAQLVGSVLGVTAGRAVWGPTVGRAPIAFAVLQPEAGMTAWEFFLAEAATMTVIILIVGLVLAVPSIASSLTPYVVGLLVGGTIAALGTITGGSANPARQFGPAVLSGQTHLLWAYLLAPFVGSLLAPAIRCLFQDARVLTHALSGTERFRDSGKHRVDAAPQPAPRLVEVATDDRHRGQVAGPDKEARQVWQLCLRSFRKVIPSAWYARTATHRTRDQ